MNREIKVIYGKRIGGTFGMEREGMVLKTTSNLRPFSAPTLSVQSRIIPMTVVRESVLLFRPRC